LSLVAVTTKCSPAHFDTCIGAAGTDIAFLCEQTIGV
jgi:hypothetical protein